MCDESIVGSARGASRRVFLRTAAAGAVGSALVVAGRGEADAASVLGEITLDALMITYFSAPFGDAVTATYMLGRAYDTTFSLRTPEAPDLALRASVAPGKERFFAGVRETQTESSRVVGAITFSRRLAHGETESVSLVPPQSPEHTVFLGLYRPRLQVLGRPDRPRFRFVPGTTVQEGSALLITNVDQLQRDPGAQGVSETTAASWLAQYQPDVSEPAPPRYVAESFSADAGFVIRTFARSVAGPELSTTVSASIVASTVGGDLAGVFETGDTLELEYFSVQEDRSGTLLTLETEVSGDAPPQRLYWDALWKTHLFVEGA